MYENEEDLHTEWIARLYQANLLGNSEGVQVILDEIQDFYWIEPRLTH